MFSHLKGTILGPRSNQNQLNNFVAHTTVHVHEAALRVQELLMKKICYPVPNLIQSELWSPCLLSPQVIKQQQQYQSIFPAALCLACSIRKISSHFPLPFLFPFPPSKSRNFCLTAQIEWVRHGHPSVSLQLLAAYRKRLAVSFAVPSCDTWNYGSQDF